MAQNAAFDLQSFLPYLLNQAAEVSSLQFKQYYKDRYGILRTEWRVLFHIGLYGEMTAREIGARAGIHKTKISRAVQKLADRRLIARHRDAKDRRMERLMLTSQGEAAFDDLRLAAERYDAQLVAALSPTEERILRDTLKKLMQA